MTAMRPFGPAKPFAICRAVKVLPLPLGPMMPMRAFRCWRTAFWNVKTTLLHLRFVLGYGRQLRRAPDHPAAAITVQAAPGNGPVPQCRPHPALKPRVLLLHEP